MLKPDRFTEQAQEVLADSQRLVQEYQHSQWDVEHVLLALLRQQDGLTEEVFKGLGVETALVRSRLEAALSNNPRVAQPAAQIYGTPRVARLLENAEAESSRLKDEFIGSEHLLIAITMEGEAEAARILKDFGIEQEGVYHALHEIRGSHRVTDPRAESHYRALEKYSRDLTEMARSGKLDPVIGRDKEIKRVIQILTRRTKNNPAIIGDAGVGKTELARALAWFMFDNEDSMVRLDMSEYMEKHTVSRLIGAPPGYVGYDEGGQLTEAVRRRPFRVILFDEVEKAHPDVSNILLQILEDGRLTDGHGRTVDFRNTVVIMTSNLGTGELKEAVGFAAPGAGNGDKATMRRSVEDALKRAFRPELLNRIDETIIFDPLSEDQIRQIVELLMREVQKRLDDRGVTVELTEAARDWLAEQGFDRVFGARPLRRTIQRHVENPLAKRLLAGEFKEGDHVLVDSVGGELTFGAAPSKIPAAT